MRSLIAGTLMLLATGHIYARSGEQYADSITGAGANQSVGLVLSGGGAKGIAHIGVIRALEDNGIPVDYVAGTSMGAIVGGLYACGYTTGEMMDLIGSRSFSYWSTGKIDEKLTYYILEPQSSPALINLSLGDKDSLAVNTLLPTSLINPLPMNFAFMDLFAGYTGQCRGDFNRLMVPFRCVASDVYAKHKVVFDSGDLGDAIRASMSFPLVFHPIEVDGHLMFDGGIYDNFPVDVMREDFAPAIMIGVDVSGPNSKPTANDLMSQLEVMIMQKSDYELPADEGIRLKLDLEEFGLLDFDKAKQIYKIGYDHAMAMMDSIKSRVHTRVPATAMRIKRESFKAMTPYVRFDSVSVNGATAKQDELIRRTFTYNRPDTFGIARARDAYYRSITSGKIGNLVPHAVFNDANGLYTLDLKATVKDNFKVKFGGYLTSSTSSMIFLSGGYNTLSFHSLDLALNGWIGQSYLSGQFHGSVNVGWARPSLLNFDIVATRQRYFENEILFFEDRMPSFVVKSEVFGSADWSVATSRRSYFKAGIGAGHLTDRFYDSSLTSPSGDATRARTIFNLGKAEAEWRFSTIDHNGYPTQGASYSVNLSAIGGSYRLRGKGLDNSSHRTGWVSAHLTSRNYFSTSRKFSIGIEGDVMLSNRGVLPTYDATIVAAQGYTPTPSCYDAFNPAFHANAWGAAGLVPVVKLSNTLQIRTTLNGFVPWRKIMKNDNGGVRLGNILSSPQFFGECAVVLKLPFANVSVYGNYFSYPARNWNCGISLGLFNLSPKFLK